MPSSEKEEQRMETWNIGVSGQARVQKKTCDTSLESSGTWKVMELKMGSNNPRLQHYLTLQGDRMGLGLSSQHAITLIAKFGNFLQNLGGLDPGGPQKTDKSRGFGQKNQSVGEWESVGG